MVEPVSPMASNTQDLATIKQRLADCPVYQSATKRILPYRRSHLSYVVPGVILQALSYQRRWEQPNPIKERLVRLKRHLPQVQCLAGSYPILRDSFWLLQAELHVLRDHYRQQAIPLRKQVWKDFLIVRLNRILQPVPPSSHAWGPIRTGRSGMTRRRHLKATGDG